MKKLLTLLLVFSMGTSVAAYAGPSRRMGSTMFYDPVHGCMLLFGGAQAGSTDYNRYNDLWKYDYSTNTWAEVSVSARPSGRFNTPAAYDTDTDQLIIYGGESTDAEPQMWAFSLEGYTWARLRPPSMPSPGRCNTPLVYNEKYGKVIMFSGMGYDSTFPGDTWVYDVAGNSWTRMTPDESPHGRYGHALFYDPVSESTLMFGGHWFEGSGEGFGEDVWRYDYGSDTWTRLGDLPLDAKFWHSYSVSGLDGSCTIFGGTNGRDFFDETWRYSGGELTRLTTGTHPSSRTLAAMAYDPANDVTLLFGGLDYTSGGDSGDLWALKSSGTWVEITGAETSVGETDVSSTVIPGFPMIAVLVGLLLIEKSLRAQRGNNIGELNYINPWLCWLDKILGQPSAI